MRCPSHSSTLGYEPSIFARYNSQDERLRFFTDPVGVGRFFPGSQWYRKLKAF